MSALDEAKRMLATARGDAPLALSPSINVGTLNLTAGAWPNGAKLQAMQDSDKKFAAAWNQARKDFSSPEQYETLLAFQAAEAGWPAQEIADLLIAWRSRHGHPTKLDQQYLSYIIGLALSGSLATVTIESFAAMPVEELINGHKAAALRDLSLKLEIPGLEELTRYIGDPDSWYITIAGRTYKLGTVHAVVNQTAFRDAVADAGCRVPEIARPKWHPISKLLLRIVKTAPMRPDSTAKGRTIAMLQDYFESAHLPTVEDTGEVYEDRIASGSPVRSKDNEAILFRGPSLHKYLLYRQTDKFTTKELNDALEVAGATGKTVNKRKPDGNWSTTRVWSIPTAYFPLYI